MAKEIKRLVLNIVFLGMLYCLSCTAPEGKYNNTTTVSIKNSDWFINGRIINENSPAEGLLMNVRMVNAVFEDSNPATKAWTVGFDPCKNVDNFIKKIPEYVHYGANAFVIGLQGGLPGYENAINTAFTPEGYLTENYMRRVEKVIEASDKEGAIVILSCFYQRQHSHENALKGKKAIFQAIEEVVRWLTEKEYSNVLLEISNEYAHGGYTNWQDGDWLRSEEGQIELIKHAKAKSNNLLVSTSGMGNGRMPEGIAKVADYILIHFNNTAHVDYAGRIEEVMKYGKPVLCNEDDKIAEAGAEEARLSVLNKAGWVFIHIKKNQNMPFEFDGAKDDTLVYEMMKTLTTPSAEVGDLRDTSISILITTPKDGDIYKEGDTLAIQAITLGLEAVPGVEVRLFANEKLIGKAATEPWGIVWKNLPAGNHNVAAVIYNKNGKPYKRSRPVDIKVE